MLIPFQQRYKLNVVSNRLSCTGKKLVVLNDNDVRTKSETGLILLRPKAGRENPHFLKEDEVDFVQELCKRPPVEDFVTDDHDSFSTLFHDHDEKAAIRMVENLEGSRKEGDAVAMGDTQSLCFEAVESFTSKVGENAA
ncbi:hypothetical protein BWQ96_08574 [Gracilariopsis chorda]|uniref:Uncharacterized protein n=1 Tax=Gracilariopsis chorda TaxID=448386 RepID=A0A2V3II15_9FLOR|nr:hypothetical protein BWQ96_10250 [Gracilariopsis chorda]PXF41712.1 hypothetical protein BWQ96_08574 [Gracilariopsis chorda]|eukprot:PXF40038.1 hypothetical protein BWQ96_10250 [Gracilariopsis chorda]